MLRKLASFFTFIMRHYLPDAYLFAILLTFLSGILALMPGRPEESHHQSPTDPYVNLSAHTARVSHSLEASRLQVDAER